MPRIRNVMLMSSFFVDQGQPCNDKITYQLALTLYQREDIILSDGGNSLLPIKMVFDLFQGLDKQPFRLMCGYRIVYEFKEQEDLDLLSDHVILAHVIPYLREHISGITVKSRFPALYIDTVNTADLLKKYHKNNLDDSPDSSTSLTS